MSDVDQKAQIAVLQTQMASIADTVARIEVKMDSFNQHFVSRSEFSEFKKRWFLSHSMAALAGSVLAGVITYLITRG